MISLVLHVISVVVSMISLVLHVISVVLSMISLVSHVIPVVLSLIFGQADLNGFEADRTILLTPPHLRPRSSALLATQMQMHCRYKRKHCHGKRKHAQCIWMQCVA